MLYRLLGPSGVKVSSLCLGTMNFGNEERWGCDEATSREIIDQFMEAGGNFIDTANVYAGGRSEEILGRALKDRRSDVILATKGYFPLGSGPNDMGSTRRNLRRQVEDSLRRLQTDRIDLYQLHIWDPLTPIEETMGVLADLVHEGKIDYIGCCNFTAWQITVAQERAEQLGLERFVTVQPQYNLLCRDIEQEVMGAADLYGMGILPWSPLARGFLTGTHTRENPRPTTRSRSDEYADRMYFRDEDFDVVDTLVEVSDARGVKPARIALAWLLSVPGVVAPIVGSTRDEHIDDSVGALEIKLTEDEIAKLERPYRPHPILGHEQPGPRDFE